jgi:hypothetical protein
VNEVAEAQSSDDAKCR